MAMVPRSQLTLIEACSLEAAKVCTGVLAPEVKKAVEQFLHLNSVAIHKEEEERTEVTTLFPHLFATRKHRTPEAILFMDLSKASDKLVREVASGVSEAHGDIDMITDALLKSGVDSVAASHLAPIVASSGGLLRQLRVPAHICNLVGRLHDQTWFQIEPGGKLIMTTRGSRQGCCFGSVFFNAVCGVTLFELSETSKTAAPACCAIVAHVHLPGSTKVTACTRTNLNPFRSQM